MSMYVSRQGRLRGLRDVAPASDNKIDDMISARQAIANLDMSTECRDRANGIVDTIEHGGDAPALGTADSKFIASIMAGETPEGCGSSVPWGLIGGIAGGLFLLYLISK